MVHSEILATPSIPEGNGVWTWYATTTINTPAKQVWDIIKNPTTYPSWNRYTPEIIHVNQSSHNQSLKVNDPITVSFRPDRTGPTQSIPCTVTSVSTDDDTDQQEIYLISWTAKVMSLPSFIFFAEKVQKITRINDSECKYEVYETQSGVLAYLVKWLMGQKMSDVNLVMALDLKRFVEEAEQ